MRVKRDPMMGIKWVNLSAEIWQKIGKFSPSSFSGQDPGRRRRVTSWADQDPLTNLILLPPSFNFPEGDNFWGGGSWKTHWDIWAKIKKSPASFTSEPLSWRAFNRPVGGATHPIKERVLRAHRGRWGKKCPSIYSNLQKFKPLKLGLMNKLLSRRCYNHRWVLK